MTTIQQLDSRITADSGRLSACRDRGPAAWHWRLAPAQTEPGSGRIRFVRRGTRPPVGHLSVPPLPASALATTEPDARARPVRSSG